MKKRNGISSRDVAREAGVSQATVSYILNNVPNVKIRPETRQSVLDAVKKLNYHPDEIARGMKLKRSMSIGVVSDRNVTNFYFMKTLEGIRDGLQQHNYSLTLLFNRTEDIQDAEFIRYYNSNRLDGIIFSFASLDEETLSYLNEKQIPYVMVDAYSTEKDVHEVCSDHLLHIPRVIELFISKGATRIGYAGPLVKHDRDRRIETFLTAMTVCGMQENRENMVLGTLGDAEVIEAVTALLSKPDKPDAILAASPRFGFLTVKCAQMLGIKVPEELFVIALGSSSFYTLTHPTLSAVELPLYDMGLRSSRMLFDILNGLETEKSVVVPSELVIRDSC